jgi:hypothetical protein
MKIKHSKYKNTGLIFELLTKQLAADILSNQNSAAISIIKKHFSNNSAVAREFKLYEYITKNKGISHNKANSIISTILEISRKFNREALNKQKYELIRDIKESYNVEDFFSIKVQNYKPLAALFCLIESHNTEEVLNPDFLVENKTTVLEHLTSQTVDKENTREDLIEEYSKYEKDLRLLAYKILLEKFNNKYETLLPTQKNVLKEFIASVSSTSKLRTFVNEQFDKIRADLATLNKNVADEVVKIKLNELSTLIKPLTASEKVSDSHLVSLMQYYELLHEVDNANK